MAAQGKKKRKARQAERPNSIGRDSRLVSAEERRIKARLKLLNSRLQLINKQALYLTAGCEQTARVRRALDKNVGAEIFDRLLGKLRQ